MSVFFHEQPEHIELSCYFCVIPNLDFVETSQLYSGKYEFLTLAELYDMLAEETVKFNKQLLQKTSREHLGILKAEIKSIQEEILKRKSEVHLP